MFIDSHCHLNFKDYNEDELASVLSRTAEADVGLMITVGAGEQFEGNLQALALAQKYPQIFCTVGVHPHDAKIVDTAMIEKIREMATHEKVVAIGEIGLDYHYTHSPKDTQERVLAQFIDLAREVNKPIAIHDRDAGDRTYDMIRASGTPGSRVMIHCYTGTMELARRYLDLGCILSFTGIVTFKKAGPVQDVVRMVPLERMLIETDSPYLAPEPHRGKRNEPAFVTHVAESIAKIKGVSLDDVARITTLNAKRFFSLPLPELTAQIAYAIRDSLYLNITNKCTLACTFCPKFVDFEVKGYYLKLAKEPTVEEILDSVTDYHKRLETGDKRQAFREAVFCGYGEPTKRLDDLITIAKEIRHRYPSLKIRLNTDGLGNLIHKRNILPELATVIDSVSVSLNAADAETYARYCPSVYKESAYPAVKEFIREATRHLAEVWATVVGMPGVDREACRKVAEDELGARFRYREYNNVG